MKINQQHFMDKNHELLEKILDISLPLGYTLLKNYIEKKGLDINSLSNYDVKSLRYGNEYVILFKRISDGKSYMLSPDVIRKVCVSQLFEGNIDNLLECCLSADQFIISEGEEECSEGLYVYEQIDKKFFYIFPLISSSSPKVVETDTFEIINNSKGISYDYPNVHYFNTCGNKYVWIEQKGKACIFSIDGREIGVFDMFGLIDGDERFSPFEKNGKYNYFSFEKECVCFNEWFDDYDYPENIDGEWIFKVKKNGVYKILDSTGNDISNNYKGVLEQWIEDSKLRMKS